MPSTVAEANGWMPDSAHGFRSGMGTVDSLLCLRLLSTYCRENKIPCFLAFIDLTKAYDKVARNALWVLLERLGVPLSIIALIKVMHEGSMAKVREESCFSEAFPLLMGLKQGSVFAPLLFNIFFGAIIKAIRVKLTSDNVNTLKVRCALGAVPFDPFTTTADRQLLKATEQFEITDFLYADDTVFPARSEEELQAVMDIAHLILTAFGQEISVKKTEVLIVQPKSAAEVYEGIVLGGASLKSVSQFKYVGSVVNCDGNVDDEVERRVRLMWMSYTKFRENVFENFALDLHSRLLAFQAFVMTCGLYGCETWNSRKEHATKLEGAQYAMLSHMLRYHWSFRKSFADVIHKCRSVNVDILPAGIMIIRQRLAYFGHVCRMGPDRLPRRLLMARLVLEDDQKTRVGPEQSYANVIAEDLAAFGIIQRIPGLNPSQWNAHRWKTILAMTSDRPNWRCKVKRDGIALSMHHFFESRCASSNKRHINDVDFLPKTPYVFNHVCSLHEKKPQEPMELCEHGVV